MVLDYVKILGVAASNESRTQCLAEYMCEMSLLHTELSVYSQGTMAAACQLLARLTLHTGITVQTASTVCLGKRIPSIIDCNEEGLPNYEI